MKISVKVIPNAKMISNKNSQIKKLADGTFKVRLSSIPENGKANEDLTSVLAKHFNCRKNQVRIAFGETSRNKIVEIIENL
jgi:uncharacterized protein YggU (UPF0235/DUF167 family)